jgi:Fe-S oxidoreductase
MTHVDDEQQDKYDNVVRNIAKLLMSAGVQFGYLYDKELYTGALVYDQGVDGVFMDHAERVYKVLEDNGVKKVITIDPHTTDMLRSVYPRIIDGYNIEVQSYLEVLAEKDPDIVDSLDADLVIHDSCVYARYENVVDQPRQLLTKAGARLHEPELSGKMTHCCGGPIESLKPAKAHEIAANRVEQLAECGKNVVTMCPICMVNLSNAAEGSIDIKDISDYLTVAYGK